MKEKISVIKRKRRRWGTKSMLILELLKEGAFCTADLLGEMFLNPITPKQRYARAIFGRQIKHEEFHIPRNTKITLYRTLYSLEKQGLVEKKNETWEITRDGKENIIESQKIKKGREYICKKSEHYTIVAFDIPEKIKAKREWLREALVNMGFSLLQQSVWIARRKISGEFIKDLHDMRISKFVHIFEVTKHGTI